VFIDHRNGDHECVYGCEMAHSKRALKIVGQMIDSKQAITTKFYIEPPGTPGARRDSRVRHLIAWSNDGRPEFVTKIPDAWSDDDILMLLNRVIRPNTCSDVSDCKIGCDGLDDDILE
jgi:hypothetical protein